MAPVRHGHYIQKIAVRHEIVGQFVAGLHVVPRVQELIAEYQNELGGRSSLRQVQTAGNRMAATRTSRAEEPI